uniref:Uncharacterized protein n=1 Tax=Plectus sambesii TaxID=2011161 RepID=A0A914X8W3_9BILA
MAHYNVERSRIERSNKKQSRRNGWLRRCEMDAGASNKRHQKQMQRRSRPNDGGDRCTGAKSERRSPNNLPKRRTHRDTSEQAEQAIDVSDDGAGNRNCFVVPATALPPSPAAN